MESKEQEPYTELDVVTIESEKKTTDRLLEWMIQNGAIMPNLYFQYYAVDFRGVCIDTDFNDDEVMVTIPLDMLVTVERAKESDIGRLITESGCKLRSHAYVACFILEEKINRSSFWKPYIDVLPKSYRNVPSQFTEEELSYLRGSLTLEEINDRRKNYTNEYRDICEHVPSFRVHPQEDYFWARLVVLTRIFGITVDGRDTSALVPMADMLNHKYPAETYWTFDQSLKSFTITSQKAFVSGEQVYDSYGRKCNTEFFMNYGFVPREPNPNNECKLILSFPEDTPLYTYKMLLLPSDLHQVQVSRDYETDECAEMWAFLRLGFCTAAEFFQLTGGGYEVADPKNIAPRNLRNELEVLRNLAVFASQSLSEFETTYEEDINILDNAERFPDEHGLSRNIINAIRARSSEKEVLQWYIDLCNNMQNFLADDVTMEEFERLIHEDPYFLEDDHVSRYAKKVILPLLEQDKSVAQLCDFFENLKVEDFRDKKYEHIPLTSTKTAAVPPPAYTADSPPLSRNTSVPDYWGGETTNNVIEPGTEE